MYKYTVWYEGLEPFVVRASNSQQARLKGCREIAIIEGVSISEIWKKKGKLAVKRGDYSGS